MSTGHEGYSPQQRAFAALAETYVAPDQAAIALAMQQRIQPVAERVEDTLLAHFARKQADGTASPSDSAVFQVAVAAGKSLDQTPEKVLTDPTAYVGCAARFMHSIITMTTESTADVFAGYTPIVMQEDQGRWSSQFHDASLTDKWEGMVVAALQMETEGLPRPATIQDLAQGAYERGLYRF